jgi:hypothetical protein
MVAVTFDTLKFVKTLQAAGVGMPQAEAQAQVLSEAFATQAQALESSIKTAVGHERISSENTLVRIESKVDKRFTEIDAKMDKRFAEIDIRFAETKGEIALLKWMLGLVVAGVLTLVLKAFLHV